jgi:putative inorganic carbon (hco3(-)) transporter
MNSRPEVLLRAARYLTFGSAVSILVSIAASQTLMGLAFAALLLSRQKPRVPRIWLPLLLFVLGTLIAVACSADWIAGLVQVRKFYVFLILILVYTVMRDLKWLRWLVFTAGALASISGVFGLVQFVLKLQAADQSGSNFYLYYVGSRITGFMSHWNTFSGLEMITLLMICAYVLFGGGTQERLWPWVSFAIPTALAILLAETRAVWIGLGVGGAYLLWAWRPRALALAPVVVVLAIFASPPIIRERITSIVRPKDVDSNSFRIVTWRTGLQMIAAHPIVGLGPEAPRIHFNEWVPVDIPRPLPVGSYIHLHNLYLEYAAERGIPTLLFLLWALLQIVWEFRRGMKSIPRARDDRRFLLNGAIAVVLAVLAEGMFEYNLGDSEVLTLFLVVVACGYLALETKAARPIQP